MGKFIVVVLDGFGVGQMPDAPQVRPADVGANTCAHIFESAPGLELPNLARLGLASACGRVFPGLPASDSELWGTANLMHEGADTFFGHQEIMGTKPAHPFGEPIQGKIDEIARALSEGGFDVEIHRSESGLRLIVVDGCCTVADNVECDPGQAFNVTAALDDMDFERELEVGRIVRSIARVPRVITFGGRGVHLDNLLGAIEEHGEYIGVNAPASGVYVNDYHCIHMGYGVDERVQAPYILGEAGVEVRLLGKVADVCANRFGTSESIVDTAEVLTRTRELIEAEGDRFICANVQETDLSGHRESVEAYVDRLRVADAGIAGILEVLGDEDVLVVMADHGNDPTIGHPHHTRERVPLLVHRRGMKAGTIGERATLSDVGATVADYFGVDAPQNGTSFLARVLE